MTRTEQITKDSAEGSGNHMSFLLRLLPVLSFVVPFLVLYFDRQTSINYYSFDITWKGRTFYIFFAWLALMEIILGWDALRSFRITKLRSVRTIVFIIALLLPTIYLICANYFSFPSGLITDWSSRIGVTYPERDIPLDAEYLVLAALFILIGWIEFGRKNLKNILVAPVFLATIGAIFTIDSFYRDGNFTPFQLLVFPTSRFAADLLNFLGYHATFLGTQYGMPILQVVGSHGSWSAAIAWPCSGVESLLIYTVTILLFLKSSGVSWNKGLVYFVFGACVTYVINILRIASIFVLAINTGGMYPGSQAQQFHDFYGQLYSVTWIIFYPLLIMGSQSLWGRFRSRKTALVHSDLMHDLEVPK